MANLRALFQKQASNQWRASWSVRISLDFLSSWQSKEAHQLVRLAILRPLSREQELGLYLTAYLNEVDVEKIDKPDGLIVKYTRSFLSDNREILASAVLSGGDE